VSLIKRIAGLLPARRTLHIHLAQQSLLAVVRHGGRIVEDGVLHVAFSNPAGQWQAPLAALGALLTQPELAYASDTQSPSGAPSTAHSAATAAGIAAGAAARAALAARLPLHVSLSGRWCQTLMAPWSDALLSEPGASRFLNMQLAAIYGDAARAWTSGSDDAPYGQPRLVCGIATELLDALHALAAEHGTRCAAIEPLTSAVCAWLAPDTPEAFAVIEPGRISMAALTNGRVTAFQSQPCSPAWHGALAQAWQRWTLRAPELASIADVTVVDLSGQPAGLVAGQLPGRFRLAGSPFVRAGAAPANAADAGTAAAAAAGPQAQASDAAARSGKLPLSIVPPEAGDDEGIGNGTGNGGKAGRSREAA